MTETETKHLIEQAARELQLENVSVTASIDQPGYYDVSFKPNVEATAVSIPMGAEFKSIINTLRSVGITTNG